MYIRIYTILHGIVQQHLFVYVLAAFLHLLDMSCSLWRASLTVYVTSSVINLQQVKWCDKLMQSFYSNSSNWTKILKIHTYFEMVFSMRLTHEMGLSLLTPNTHSTATGALRQCEQACISAAESGRSNWCSFQWLAHRRWACPWTRLCTMHGVESMAKYV